MYMFGNTMTGQKKLVFDDKSYYTFTSGSHDRNTNVSSIKIREYGKSSFTKVFFIILAVTVLASLFSVLEKLIK